MILQMFSVFERLLEQASVLGIQGERVAALDRAFGLAGTGRRSGRCRHGGRLLAGRSPWPPPAASRWSLRS